MVKKRRTLKLTRKMILSRLKVGITMYELSDFILEVAGKEYRRGFDDSGYYSKGHKDAIKDIKNGVVKGLK